jgi:hypothetical protein
LIDAGCRLKSGWKRSKSFKVDALTMKLLRLKGLTQAIGASRTTATGLIISVITVAKRGEKNSDDMPQV